MRIIAFYFSTPEMPCAKSIILKFHTIMSRKRADLRRIVSDYEISKYTLLGFAKDIQFFYFFSTMCYEKGEEKNTPTADMYIKILAIYNNG